MSTNVRHVNGNLLDSEAEAICNPVNLAGAMGAGLALQFKKRWPNAFTAYRRALARGELRSGTVHGFQLETDRWLIHCPTKRHWREQSPLRLVERTIRALGTFCKDHGIRSVGVPPLGCGLGGLDRRDVRTLLEKAAQDHTDIEWILYGFHPADDAPRPPKGRETQ